MDDFAVVRPHHRRFVAFVLGCLTAACGAGAQTISSSSRPVLLNQKSAASLILDQSKPEYPPVAKNNFIQGKVRMQVLVSSEGKVTEANVVQGHPLLAAAALQTVRRWRYKPLKTAAGAVPFITHVDVNFSLRSMKIDQVPPDAQGDLGRQIRPPELVGGSPARSPLVHLRVLVSEDGRPIDVAPVEGFPYQYDAELKLVERCKFQPARWGSLAVPWYADVDVPAKELPASAEGQADQ